MVRLKEPNRLPIATIIEISIPYGSIKRQIPTAFSAAFCAFQFLMVRLKVREPTRILNTYLNFNSLWFD